MIASTGKTFQRLQQHKNIKISLLTHLVWLIKEENNMHMDTKLHQNKKNKSI